jgi:Arc/MetJ family transcription regulator
MPLLNYTTEVPVMRTAGQIQAALVQAGARRISTDYDAVGQPVGISFEVETGFGVRHFALPVNRDAVHAVLQQQKVEPRYRTLGQAERVAWRIMKDWVEAQLAIIQTNMVTLDQVMLPYMLVDDGRTVYEVYRDQQLALPAGSK